MLAQKLAEPLVQMKFNWIELDDYCKVHWTRGRCFG